MILLNVQIYWFFFLISFVYLTIMTSPMNTDADHPSFDLQSIHVSFEVKYLTSCFIILNIYYIYF